MQKKWKLLTEEEVRLLSEEGLGDYYGWLKKQKNSMQKDLDQRRTIFNKIIKALDEDMIENVSSRDDEELLRVRKELNI